MRLSYDRWVTGNHEGRRVIYAVLRVLASYAAHCLPQPDDFRTKVTKQRREQSGRLLRHPVPGGVSRLQVSITL
jgi:hypothetical protein